MAHLEEGEQVRFKSWMEVYEGSTDQSSHLGLSGLRQHAYQLLTDALCIGRRIGLHLRPVLRRPALNIRVRILRVRPFFTKLPHPRCDTACV